MLNFMKLVHFHRKLYFATRFFNFSSFYCLFAIFNQTNSEYILLLEMYNVTDVGQIRRE